MRETIHDGCSSNQTELLFEHETRSIFIALQKSEDVYLSTDNQEARVKYLERLLDRKKEAYIDRAIWSSGNMARTL